MGRYHWSPAPPPTRTHGWRVGTVHGTSSQRVPCSEAISTVFSLFGRFHIAPYTHTHVQYHYCVMCARSAPRATRCPSSPTSPTSIVGLGQNGSGIHLAFRPETPYLSFRCTGVRYGFICLVRVLYPRYRPAVSHSVQCTNPDKSANFFFQRCRVLHADKSVQVSATHVVFADKLRFFFFEFRKTFSKMAAVISVPANEGNFKYVIFLPTIRYELN